MSRNFNSLFTLLLLSLSFATGCGSEEPGSGSATTSQEMVPIPIGGQANVAIADMQGLPTGTQELSGVLFATEGKILQLGSPVFPKFPQSITGIPVSRKLSQLHFLHSSQGGAYQRKGHAKHEEDGVLVGQYTVHYEDGSTQAIPLIYGEDLRGWWNWDQQRATTRAQLAWEGENPMARRNNVSIRLFKLTWNNPMPDKTITQIDFQSAQAKAAPFCVAITGSLPSE